MGRLSGWVGVGVFEVVEEGGVFFYGCGCGGFEAGYYGVCDAVPFFDSLSRSTIVVVVLAAVVAGGDFFFPPYKTDRAHAIEAVFAQHLLPRRIVFEAGDVAEAKLHVGGDISLGAEDHHVADEAAADGGGATVIYVGSVQPKAHAAGRVSFGCWD